MALVQYNATLEYATNTLEFWYYGDEGEELAFDAGTSFSIQRIDNTSNVYTVVGTIDGNKVTFIVDPPSSLQGPDDSLYDYDHPEYNHIYSVRSASQVYISGKLNLVEVA